jgi:predicted nucleotide-binding protein
MGDIADAQLDQYAGDEGRARLREAIEEHKLVRHDPALAARLADALILRAVDAGGILYEQGTPGTRLLYLLVSGAMELLIEDRTVNELKPGDLAGEFPMLDPGDVTVAVTLRAKGPSVVGTVTEAQFRALADDHGVLWKNLARMLEERLKNTNEQIPKRKPTCVFIGHGRSAAWTRIDAHLREDLALPTVNYESASRVGLPIATVLEEMLAQATFAILVLTAEDQTAEGVMRTRQNVVHEAGLFQGRLGFRRAILLIERGVQNFSNSAGLQHIAFDGNAIESCFPALRRVLEREGHLPA